MEPLAKLQPEKIVYMSCDPMTCFRDVSMFLKRGYAISDMRGFDTMPHTPHLELVVVLEKDKGVEQVAVT